MTSSLAAVTVVLVLGTAASREVGLPPDCGPAKSAHARELLQHVKSFMSSNTRAAVRARQLSGFGRLEETEIQMLDHDETCNRAARLINNANGKPVDRPLQVYVVQADSLLWAEAPSIKGGGYTPNYILNRDATRIISVQAR